MDEEQRKVDESDPGRLAGIEEPLARLVAMSWVFWTLEGGITRRAVENVLTRARRESQPLTEVQMLRLIYGWLSRRLASLEITDEPWWELTSGAWQIVENAGGLSMEWTSAVIERAERGGAASRELLALVAVTRWIGNELDCLSRDA
jgi:hypothetical protein